MSNNTNMNWFREQLQALEGNPRYSPGSFWIFRPNFPAPVAFATIFVVCGAVQAYQTFHYKSWRATALLPWAALLMAVGFETRAGASYDTDNLALLISSSVFVMIAPPIYAAADYFIFSRILFYYPYLSPVNPSRIVSTFLGIDLFIEILTAVGASQATNPGASATRRNTGFTLMRVALILQALMFASFVAFVAFFHRRAATPRPAPGSGENKNPVTTPAVLTPKLRTVLFVIYANCALIFMRCVFRIAEYFEPTPLFGHLWIHEEYFWALDAAPMLLATIIFNIWHPGSRLPRDSKAFLVPDGKGGVVERHGPGWTDNRAWLRGLLDPFDFAGEAAGTAHRKFWEMSDEEIRELEEETERNKRPFKAAFLDPLGLIWGPGGSKDRKRRETEAVEGTYEP